MPEIYKITNKINDKTYVGQTKNSLEKRKPYHLQSVNHNSKYPIHCAIRKYGIENFLFETIELCDESELNKKEIFWIKELNSLCQNGYNIRNGGRGKQPEDLKLRIRESLKHRRNPTLQFNPKTGKIINEFVSLCEASRQLGIARENLSSCTKNYTKRTNKGFGFIYKEDYKNLKDKSQLIIKNWKPIGKRGRAVYGINDNGDKINFDFIVDAAKFINGKHSDIIGSIKNGHKCKNYKWYYKENEVSYGR